MMLTQRQVTQCRKMGKVSYFHCAILIKDCDFKKFELSYFLEEKKLKRMPPCTELIPLLTLQQFIAMTKFKSQ